MGAQNEISPYISRNHTDQSAEQLNHPEHNLNETIDGIFDT